MKEFGLIGRKLSHSFSKSYFEEKFLQLGLTNYYYHLFEMDSIYEIDDLLGKHPYLKGLNVTIPFKQDVFEILDDIERNAQRIGSVNVIKILSNKRLKGFNTDYYGFHESLLSWLPEDRLNKTTALVLGSGGASKAVCCVLEDLEIDYRIVSRRKRKGFLGYDDLKNEGTHILNNKLIINTTPLGMYPKNDTCPDIDMGLISGDHYVYDLVYNPQKTRFLEKSEACGATIKNGLEMLHLQAEKSWEVWNR